MSSRRNWDSPNPSLDSECAPPLSFRTGGGEVAHSPAGEGSPNSDDWRKSIELCLLSVQLHT